MSTLDGRLSARLNALLTAHPTGDLRLRHLFGTLAGRGHAALLVVLALPFCLPLPLFGLSTVFGLVLAFVGLRIAFARRPWLPRWILEKTVRRETLEGLATKTAALERRLHRVLRARVAWICRQPTLHRAHGITVTIMALLLALPLPIPLSNIIAALPILLMGLALLEDDGVCVLVSYAAALLGITGFVVLFWTGTAAIGHLQDVVRGWLD